eukprot:3192627-Pyramimonas_sp.AAC.1
MHRDIVLRLVLLPGSFDGLELVSQLDSDPKLESTLRRRCRHLTLSQVTATTTKTGTTRGDEVSRTAIGLQIGCAFRKGAHLEARVLRSTVPVVMLVLHPRDDVVWGPTVELDAVRDACRQRPHDVRVLWLHALGHEDGVDQGPPANDLHLAAVPCDDDRRGAHGRHHAVLQDTPCVSKDDHLLDPLVEPVTKSNPLTFIIDQVQGGSLRLDVGLLDHIPSHATSDILEALAVLNGGPRTEQCVHRSPRMRRAGPGRRKRPSAASGRGARGRDFDFGRGRTAHDDLNGLSRSDEGHRGFSRGGLGSRGRGSRRAA